MKKLNQEGLIPLLLFMFAVVIGIAVLAFLRVQSQQ